MSSVFSRVAEEEKERNFGSGWFRSKGKVHKDRRSYRSMWLVFIDAEEHAWLFKKKTNMDGVVHTYKARLVVKGYTQTSGIDYKETFSSVADIRAIRILIAITAYYDYEIWQIDVKTAFLNGNLFEENSKRGSILMQEKLRLSKSQGASTLAELKCMQNVPYASAVGSIIIQLKVSCYIDAEYLTDADDLKSRTGYVFVLNGGAVDWKSAKQSIFTTLSAEAEYIAAYDDFKEAIWVRKFISRLGIVLTIEEPISMYCGNTEAITIANESGITKGARQELMVVFVRWPAILKVLERVLVH
ncbi:retrotransposon protein, putative, ty1-copia subclass [Tanacetum coccineum]